MLWGDPMLLLESQLYESPIIQQFVHDKPRNHRVHTKFIKTIAYSPSKTPPNFSPDHKHHANTYLRRHHRYSSPIPPQQHIWRSCCIHCNRSTLAAFNTQPPCCLCPNWPRGCTIIKLKDAATNRRKQAGKKPMITGNVSISHIIYCFAIHRMNWNAAADRNDITPMEENWAPEQYNGAEDEMVRITVLNIYKIVPKQLNYHTFQLAMAPLSWNAKEMEGGQSINRDLAITNSGETRGQWVLDSPCFIFIEFI